MFGSDQILNFSYLLVCADKSNISYLTMYERFKHS